MAHRSGTPKYDILYYRCQPAQKHGSRVHFVFTQIGDNNLSARYAGYFPLGLVDIMYGVDQCRLYGSEGMPADVNCCWVIFVFIVGTI